VTLGLGLLAAGFHARGREGRARTFPGSPELGSGDRPAVEALEAAVAELPRLAELHLGRGARDAVVAGLATRAPDAPARAQQALRVARAVAGERWLARSLGAALGRLPAPERERIAKILSSVPRLARVASDLVLGAAPPAEQRFALFRAVPILGPAADDDVRALALLAVRETVPFGRAVIRQGDEGDRFYVIVSGDAQVSVQGKDGFDRTVANLRAGDAFGEAALLRHEPRSASVTATSPTLELLAVEREAFLAFVRSRKTLLQRILDRVEDTWLVRSMAIFSELDGAQVNALFQRFVELKVASGVEVIRQGEAGDRFYVVREGTLTVSVKEDGARREIATLGRGDSFGEMALLHDAPRAATVTADTDAELLALDRKDFLRTLSGRSLVSLEAQSQRRAQALQDGPS
jgi:CRP-like cAMP-binding protein